MIFLPGAVEGWPSPLTRLTKAGNGVVILSVPSTYDCWLPSAGAIRTTSDVVALRKCAAGIIVELLATWPWIAEWPAFQVLRRWRPYVSRGMRCVWDARTDVCSCRNHLTSWGRMLPPRLGKDPVNGRTRRRYIKWPLT